MTRIVLILVILAATIGSMTMAYDFMLQREVSPVQKGPDRVADQPTGIWAGYLDARISFQSIGEQVNISLNLDNQRENRVQGPLIINGYLQLQAIDDPGHAQWEKEPFLVTIVAQQGISQGEKKSFPVGSVNLFKENAKLTSEGLLVVGIRVEVWEQENGKLTRELTVQEYLID